MKIVLIRQIIQPFCRITPGRALPFGLLAPDRGIAFVRAAMGQNLHASILFAVLDPEEPLILSFRTLYHCTDRVAAGEDNGMSRDLRSVPTPPPSLPSFTVSCLRSASPPEAKHRPVIVLRERSWCIDQTLPPE